MSNIARKFVLASPFKGMPKLSNFKLVEEKLPAIRDGEILCKAEWLTVDPYMRFANKQPGVGGAYGGGQVARVIESRCKDFPEGSQIVGMIGWRDKTVMKVPGASSRHYGTMYAMPDMKGLSDSLALGAVGLPGNTAYFGLNKICEPQAGETVVVSSAAGAVGSLVGQIAKIKGCKVLGYAGSDEKVEWLKTLGFDHCFNYKTTKLRESLKEYAKDGVDCYFDNVGGEFTFHVMRAMNMSGRIAVCGAISVYNSETGGPPMVPMDYFSLIYKNLKMEGFMVMKWYDQWFEGLSQMRDWIVEGKIQVRETVTEGFENMPQGFIELLEGKNLGKAVIKA